MHTSFKALTAGVLAEYGVQAINLDASHGDDFHLHDEISDYKIDGYTTLNPSY